jgi:hypothetical protein
MICVLLSFMPFERPSIIKKEFYIKIKVFGLFWIFNLDVFVSTHMELGDGTWNHNVFV